MQKGPGELRFDRKQTEKAKAESGESNPPLPRIRTFSSGGAAYHHLLPDTLEKKGARTRLLCLQLRAENSFAFSSSCWRWRGWHCGRPYTQLSRRPHSKYLRRPLSHSLTLCCRHGARYVTIKERARPGRSWIPPPSRHLHTSRRGPRKVDIEVVRSAALYRSAYRSAESSSELFKRFYGVFYFPGHWLGGDPLTRLPSARSVVD